jgi:hypothetical protein
MTRHGKSAFVFLRLGVLAVLIVLFSADKGGELLARDENGGKTKPSPAAWTSRQYDLAGSCFNPSDSTGSATQPFTFTGGFPLVGDVNGDGKAEIVNVNKEQKVCVYDPSGKLLNAFKVDIGNSEIVALTLLYDYDKDGALDIAVGTGNPCLPHIRAKRDLRAYFFTCQGKELAAFKSSGGSDSNMTIIAVTDKQVLINYSTGHFNDPRGPAAFSRKTGEELWHYDVGTFYGANSVADIDGDGLLEIASFSGSTHNGGEGDGWKKNGTNTTDSDIYSIVVKEDGSEVFTHDFFDDKESEGSARSNFIDPEGKGKYEVLVLEGHGHDIYRGTAQVHLLDTKTGKTLKSFDGAVDSDWRGYAFGDFNGDGTAEIAATLYDTPNGAYVQYLLDKDLKLIAKSALSGNLLAANDVDGDGKAELLFGSGNEVIVTNLEFTEKWRLKADHPVTDALAVDVDGDGVNEIIVGGDATWTIMKPRQ